MRTEWAGREAADEIVAALRAWEAPGGWGRHLHAGDIGWHLRHDDATVDGSLLVCHDGDDVVAVGLLDGPAVVRLDVAPGREGDRSLAGAVADAALDRLGDGEAYVDGPVDGVWRPLLVERGWDLDPDVWVHLWQPLGADVSAADGPGTVVAVGPDEVEDRVAVQRAAFEGSTSTVEGWDRLAASTAYDPRFDLLARDADGIPVAALTAWHVGPGRCAYIEPMGTARDHTGKGHGRRLLRAAAALLAEAGASGIAVWTPASNAAGVAAYRSAGFAGVAVSAAMTSPSRSTS